MRRDFAAVLLLPLALGFVGCTTSPEVEQVRWEIERRLPGARFERDSHFHLGRISMGLLRGLVRMTPADAEDIEPLNAIRSIEIGVYKVRSLPDLEQSASLLPRFEERLKKHGWSLALHNRDAEEQTWMFVRGHRDGTLRNFFIVSLEPDELVLLRVDGRLERLFAEGMAKDPKKAVEMIGGEPSQVSPAS